MFKNLLEIAVLTSVQRSAVRKGAMARVLPATEWVLGSQVYYKSEYINFTSNETLSWFHLSWTFSETEFSNQSHFFTVSMHQRHQHAMVA